MTLMAQPSRKDMAQGNSLIATDMLLSIVTGNPCSDIGHQITLMSRVHQCTSAAADPEHYQHEENREPFNKALGEETDAFLKAFNDLCERFRTASEAGAQPDRFVCEGDEKTVLVAGLAKFKEATKGYGGFYFLCFLPPPARDHSRCTGR